MNTDTTTDDALPSRWPHRIAILLAAVVFPLIWVGGLVTTYDAGMAVPDWPGTYGYNMFLYPIETWISGPFDLLVEHGHRLLGSLSGLIAIVLVIVTWKSEPRRSVRWLSVALLLLVIGHVAVGASPSQYRLLILLHVSTAVLIVAGTAAQWLGTRRSHRRSIGIRGSINMLLLLVGVQFLLGFGTWVVKFGWPVWFANMKFAATFVVGEKTFLQLNLITAHQAIGSLILAFWTVHLLRCYRAMGPGSTALNQSRSTVAASRTENLAVKSAKPLITN